MNLDIATADRVRLKTSLLVSSCVGPKIWIKPPVLSFWDVLKFWIFARQKYNPGLLESRPPHVGDISTPSTEKTISVGELFSQELSKLL
jgi:hypothetical protein